MSPQVPGTSRTQSFTSSQQLGRAQGMHRTKTSYTDEETRLFHEPKPAPRMSVVLIALLASFVVAIIIVVLCVFQCQLKLSLVEQEEAYITIEIPSGYGAGDIAQLLRDNGVIDSTTTFIQAVSAASANDALIAGTYTFARGTSDESLVAALVAGPENTGTTVTIPEGYTVVETAQVFSNLFNFTYEEFMEVAKASNFIGDFTFLNGAYDDSLEGFLFPKTYMFEDDVTPEECIQTMLEQYEIETSTISWSDIGQGATSLSQYEVICMASLIEKESAVEDERVLIASVIYNRLNSGWQLQIDAAINYVLNKSGLLSYEDLEIDSPYNTYLNYGLVPGPICSPSLSSIEAVINAAQTDYYYYVASYTLDGSHIFCSTYEEFEYARALYNEAVGI